MKHSGVSHLEVHTILGCELGEAWVSRRVLTVLGEEVPLNHVADLGDNVLGIKSETTASGNDSVRCRVGPAPSGSSCDPSKGRRRCSGSNADGDREDSSNGVEEHHDDY